MADLDSRLQHTCSPNRSNPLVAMKPNYQYDKRQRDLAKKKLQDEKRLKKRAKGDEPAAPDAPAGQPEKPAQR